VADDDECETSLSQDTVDIIVEENEIGDDGCALNAPLLEDNEVKTWENKKIRIRKNKAGDRTMMVNHENRLTALKGAAEIHAMWSKTSQKKRGLKYDQPVDS
jgi:hypothetical protein